MFTHKCSYIYVVYLWVSVWQHCLLGNKSHWMCHTCCFHACKPTIGSRELLIILVWGTWSTFSLGLLLSLYICTVYWTLLCVYIKQISNYTYCKERFLYYSLKGLPKALLENGRQPWFDMMYLLTILRISELDISDLWFLKSPFLLNGTQWL